MSVVSPFLPSSPRTPVIDRRNTGIERSPLKQLPLSFDSPVSAASKKRPKFTNSSEEIGAQADIENSGSHENVRVLKHKQAAAKVETSFRAFLSSFPIIDVSTTTKAPAKQPPPMKKGQTSKLTLEERMARLQHADIGQEKLTFIQAAYGAANSIGSLQCVGSGTFSDVYLEPTDGSTSATVKKVFKEFSSTTGTLRPLQGTTRLYDLAHACEQQYQQIRAAHNKGLFPVDALPILNLSSWRQEGVIRQPFVTKMFQPSWDAFVAKINAYGKDAKITDEEEQLLQTIQDVVKRSIELGLCIDFKPDNLGYINIQGQERVVIIDTFGLSGSETADVGPMNRANIQEFAQRNSIIQAFLAQAVDKH